MRRPSAEKEFCGDGCQKNSEGGGCGEPNRSTCAVRDPDPLKLKRRIAYYEIFTEGRSCGVKKPEDLPLAPLTHLNLAFVNFDENWELVDEHQHWVRRAALRKLEYPNLRINIAIGGWAFNDPPTSTYFSDMASTDESRQKFVKSVVRYLQMYGLDGVDIDWEYPVTPDRGGHGDDGTNYVVLLADLREEFDAIGAGWEISVAIPSSYWYLRGFELKSMEKYVDYFNLMSYDIYGMWDYDNEWTGPYLKGHTDWSKIDQGLDLLWRNGISPDNVVMGFGFYGRSFTMKDTNCIQPNGVCEFDAGGRPGTCTGEAGVLAYYEIASRNDTLDVAHFYEKNTTVKWNVFEASQWVSYDDWESFPDKLDKLASRCLSGLMIWAIDQDTPEFKAMGELFGDYSHLELDGLNGDTAEKLHDMFGQYNGQDCFVTEKCTDGTADERGPGQVCPAGYMSVETAHNPLQRYPHKLGGECKEGWFRHICCPKNSMPHDCEWVGLPERSAFGCTGQCGPGTFELNQDDAKDAKGEAMCYQGTRKLCCRSTELFDNSCYFEKCQGPLLETEFPTCIGGWDYYTFRHDKPKDDGLCREEYGTRGSPYTKPFKSGLCCHEDRPFKNCHWSNFMTDSIVVHDPERMCLPSPCGKDQIQIAKAKTPPVSSNNDGIMAVDCDAVPLPPNYDPYFPYCCDPPAKWSKDWPIDPEDLWEEHFNNPEEDKAIWEYSQNFPNNDADEVRGDPTDIDGSDAFGFMMLNGKEEAIDDNFGASHTVVTVNPNLSKAKREIITTNQTLIDEVFEHSEETFFVYCNYPAGSKPCEAVWKGGVEDTIIRLPDHVGEGPFARIVSIELTDEEYQLPSHHIKHRSLSALHDNPVYKVKIDYNFHLVRQDRGNVQIRIDYTNLLGYWDEVTAAEMNKKKRSRIMRGDEFDDETFHMGHFRERVKRAEKAEPELRKRRVKRNSEIVDTTVPLDFNDLDHDDCEDTTESTLSKRDGVEKRWWGIFKDWVARLTTVQDGAKGDLPLDYANDIKIFEARAGCPGRAYSAKLRADLQIQMSMQARYAYYYSGTFIPPTKPHMFFYFGIEPEAYMGLKLVGDARLGFGSGRKKVIDTIGYPGLAVKGIAAVGPTLDVYGEMKGEVNVHGELRAGVEIKFDKAEAYWPQDDGNINEYDDYLDLGLKDDMPRKPKNGPTIEPVFEAGVRLEAGLIQATDFSYLLQANVGIKVGGGKWVGGRTLVDAQLTAFLFSAIKFDAKGTWKSVTNTWAYSYGVYLFYNIGYKAKATVLDWIGWSTGERKAYDKDRRFDIYGPVTGEIQLGGGSTKRMLGATEGLLSYDNMTVYDPARALFSRADDEDDPGSPTFTNPITCSAGDSKAVTLPELKFNCAAFPPMQLKGVYTTKGLCEGYKKTSGLPMTLTHSPTYEEDNGKYDHIKKRNNEKRNQQCPARQCKATTQAMHAAIGWTDPLKKKLECDEFPWASSEEGGHFKPAGERNTECVPSIQNGRGGGCIKLLSGLQSNVGKMEPGIENIDDRKDQWVLWGGRNNADFDWWFTEGQTLGSNQIEQRFTEYTEKQPIPVGFGHPGPLWTKGDKFSWVFKRNYTFSLTDDGTKSSEWWGATGKSFLVRNKRFRYPNDYASVVCGLNIFDQTDYYKYPTSGGREYNALCLTSATLPPVGSGWDDQYSVANCKVDFGTTVTKRSETGEETKEYKIEYIIDDEDTTFPLEDWLQMDENGEIGAPEEAEGTQ
ncbi:hypothetical protein DL767_009698 [Monosporascus sp. MG133]|nr:hypothetical protein DL767_009698 [Monosporascus sp. MG133]